MRWYIFRMDYGHVQCSEVGERVELLALSFSVLFRYLPHDLRRVRPVEVAAHMRGIFRHSIVISVHFLNLGGSVAMGNILPFSFSPIFLAVEKTRTQLRPRPVAAGILEESTLLGEIRWQAQQVSFVADISEIQRILFVLGQTL